MALGKTVRVSEMGFFPATEHLGINELTVMAAEGEVL